MIKAQLKSLVVMTPRCGLNRGGGGGDAMWGCDTQAWNECERGKTKQKQKKELTRWCGQTRTVAGVDEPGRGEGGS